MIATMRIAGHNPKEALRKESFNKSAKEESVQGARSL